MHDKIKWIGHKILQTLVCYSVTVLASILTVLNRVLNILRNMLTSTSFNFHSRLALGSYKGRYLDSSEKCQMTT